MKKNTYSAIFRCVSEIHYSYRSASIKVRCYFTKKLMAFQDEILLDPERPSTLVGKLIYLIVTRSDISYVVGVVSQFM